MLQICWERWHVEVKVSNWPATGISSENCTWMDLIQNLLASRFREQRWTKMKNAWRSILAILLRFLRSYHTSVTFCRYTLNSQRKTGHRQDMITSMSALRLRVLYALQHTYCCDAWADWRLNGVHPSIPLPSPWMWIISSRFRGSQGHAWGGYGYGFGLISCGKKSSAR